jgi:hypothetical protein
MTDETPVTLSEVIAEYRRAVAAGQRPDHEALLARYPHLADKDSRAP